MATLRTTAAGAYVEQDPPNRLRVTTAGAYVEQDPPNRLRVTTAGAYVEQRPQAKVKITVVGAYIELSVGEVHEVTTVGISYTYSTATVLHILVSLLVLLAVGISYACGAANLIHLPFWLLKLGEFYLPAPDRDGITVQTTRLGSFQRMSDGSLRADVIALKANITLRWSLLSVAERTLIVTAWQAATTVPQRLKLPDQRVFTAVLASADLEESQIWDVHNVPWYNIVLRLEEA